MAEPVFSGARAKLIVDGEEIGFATGVSASEQISHQRVDILGNIDSQELVAFCLFPKGNISIWDIF